MISIETCLIDGILLFNTFILYLLLILVNQPEDRELWKAVPMISIKTCLIDGYLIFYISF